MGRSCTVCDHPEQGEINRQLISSDSIPSMARNFAVSEDALRWHKENHLKEDVADVYQAMVEAREETLSEIHGELEAIKNEVKEDMTNRLLAAVSALEKIRALQDRNIKILDSVEDDDDRSSTLKAIREVRQNIEREAKLTGEIEGGQVNVMVSLNSFPEWIAPEPRL